MLYANLISSIPVNSKYLFLVYDAGFWHVMMANLITPFLYPWIINGITQAPLIVFHPDFHKAGKRIYPHEKCRRRKKKGEEMHR